MSMKLLCPYFVQHLLHQINTQQFYTDFEQQIEEFKDFSRSLRNFPVLYKADLIFKDISSKPSKLKYFSSMFKPCIKIYDRSRVFALLFLY